MIKIKITYTDIIEASDLDEPEELFLQQMERDIMYKDVSACNFVEYIDDAIAKNHTALEQSDNHVVIHRLQGAIGALRRLKYLREEVLGKDG